MEYLLKSSIVIGIFYICFHALLKRETFFNHNRWFLLTGLIIALIFPKIVIPVYEILPVTQSIITNTYIPETVSNSIVSTPKEPSYSWTDIFMIIYILGLAVCLIQFILQFGSLIVLLIKNPKNKSGLFTYVIVASKISPFSFFKWIVFNPDSFSKEELKLILTHEKVHASQWHTMDILFTHLACVIFWFNPLIWLYKKDIKQNLEYIADFKTQSTSTNQKDYQELLVKTSVSNYNISISNNFYSSLIKKRIIMLNKSRSRKMKQWKFLLVLPLLTILLMSVNRETIYVKDKDATNEIIKNAIITPIVTKPKIVQPQTPKSITKKTVEATFNKNTTDKSLESIKKMLAENGVTMTINNLKRNDDGIITDINITFSSDDNSASYAVSNTNGIEPFHFKMSDDNFSVGRNSSNNIRKLISYAKADSLYKFSASNVYVYKKDSDSSKRFILKSNNSPRSFFINTDFDSISTDSSKVKWTTKVYSNFFEDDDKKSDGKKSDKNYKYKTSYRFFTSDDKKPLVIINGKESNGHKFKLLNSDNISSVNIIKDSAAIKTYGKKGANGVVVITTDTDGNNIWKSKAKNKVKVSGITYFDDDSDKDAILNYIDKTTSDLELKSYKANLALNGIKFKYSKLKRNKQGHITAIKVSLEKDNDEASASWRVNDGIPNIEIGIKGNELIARTKQD